MRKYSGTYYNTKEKAQAALERWRKKAYRDIEKKGDKVLRDDSRVILKPVWTKPSPININEPNGLHSSAMTNVFKWFVLHIIWTQGLVDDIRNLKPIDVQAEEAKLLNDPSLQAANKLFFENLKKNKKP